jgi:hypothetical protein
MALRGWVAMLPLLALCARALAQPAGALSEDIVETVIDPAMPGDDAGDDVTEVIAESTPSEQEDTASTTRGPGPGVVEGVRESSQTKVSGWARESFEFYPDDDGLARGDRADITHVPRDRLISRTQLLIRASYQREKWFEASVSGALGMAIQIEGSGENLGFREWGSQGTGVLLDANLREAFLGFYGRKFDLRLGQQRVAWGVADVLSPNDVVNARDLRDPFLAEPEMLRIPTPVVRGSAYWGAVTLELLFSPVFVPDRGSLYGRNWSAIQPDAPAEVRGLFATLARSVDPSVQENVNEALYQTRLPNRNGSGLSGGAKMAVHSRALDLNFYYHFGYDGMPYLWIDPALLGVLRATDFGQSGVAALAPILRAVDGGFVPLYAEYVRRHHAGFDLVAEAGPFMLRIDAAYQSQRVFYRSDLASIASPAVLGVLSLDYQTGSVDKVFIVEWVYIRVIDTQGATLLAYEQDSYGAAAVLRWPLFSVFHLDVRSMVGIAPFFYVVQPALNAKVGSFQIKLGALVLDGEPNSFGWYYRHNLAGFLQVRYGF